MPKYYGRNFPEVLNFVVRVLEKILSINRWKTLFTSLVKEIIIINVVIIYNSLRKNAMRVCMCECRIPTLRKKQNGHQYNSLKSGNISTIGTNTSSGHNSK